MASAAGLRPNHYEALGLEPTATQEEISRAFARAMSLFGAHSIAGAAQLSIAFETLRNPDRRRAYDESIGIRREHKLQSGPTAVSFRISARLVGAEPHVEQQVTEPPAAPAPKPEAVPEPKVAERQVTAEAREEPKVASFIASSLRDIARPISLDTAPKPAPPPPLERPAPPREPRIEQLLALDSADEDPEERPFDWRRPAIGVGAVVLAAGLIGALAGVSVREDVQSQQAPVAAKPTRAAPAAVAPQAPANTETAPLVAAAAPAAPHPRQVRATVQPKVAPAPEQPDPLAPQPDATVASADAPAVTAAAPSALVQEAAADLPLARNVIARTIHKIGYRCGAVSATEAVDGAPGVFTVTCASGDTYRAAPVHGRYRFHRMSH
ncbi:MAG: J domain-containing protein [Bacillota bacterium]